MKKCSHCHEEKPLEAFSNRTASKDGKSYNCKKCEREIATASYKRKKKKIREKKYYEANREHLLELSAKNYQDNKETRLAQNAQYRAEHPETARKSNKTRRERIKQQQGTPYTRQEVMDRDTVDGTLLCRLCLEPITDLNELEIDHIIPIAKGGLDCIDNVRCTHGTCNRLRPKDGRDLNVE